MGDFEYAPHMRNEKERYIKNPLRLIHALTDLALRAVDDNLYTFEDGVESRPFIPENYPMEWSVEAPCLSEDDLLQLPLWETLDELERLDA